MRSRGPDWRRRSYRPRHKPSSCHFTKRMMAVKWGCRKLGPNGAAFAGSIPRGPVCRKIGTRGTAMNVNLSPEIESRVKDELAAGQYRDLDQFVETAVQYFLDQRQRSQQRLQALRRIGQAVDAAGLYERVLVPSQE